MVAWNATEADYPRDKCVHELVEAQAARTPEAIAVVYGDTRLTYAELDAGANRLAHRLRALNVRPGDRAAIALERSIELVVAQLAILKCGAAYVPLDRSAPPQRQAFMVADCEARVVVTAAGAIAPEMPGVTRVDIDLKTLPGPDTRDWEPSADGEAIAYVMYTSGSTGQPKGVMAPHRAIGRLALNNGYADFRPTDRVAFASNPAFDASTMEVWATLINGGSVVVVDQATLLDPQRFKRWLEDHAISVLWLTAGLFHQYADALAQPFARLRILITGGDVVDPRVAARVLERSPRSACSTATAPPKRRLSPRLAKSARSRRRRRTFPSAVRSRTPESTFWTVMASRSRSARRARSISAGQGSRAAISTAPN